MRYRAELSVAAGAGKSDKVGVTVWGRRISPVFDAAQTLLIVELVAGSQFDSQHLRITPGRTEEVICLLRECGVQALICGAISAEPARKIEDGGIRLIPFIAGKIEQVLAWYGREGSVDGYQMPGCHEQGRGRGGHCCRAGVFSNKNGPAHKKNS